MVDFTISVGQERDPWEDDSLAETWRGWGSVPWRPGRHFWDKILPDEENQEAEWIKRERGREQ